MGATIVHRTRHRMLDYGCIYRSQQVTHPISQIDVCGHIHGLAGGYDAGLEAQEGVVRVPEGAAQVAAVPEGHLCPGVDALDLGGALEGELHQAGSLSKPVLVLWRPNAYVHIIDAFAGSCIAYMLNTQARSGGDLWASGMGSTRSGSDVQRDARRAWQQVRLRTHSLGLDYHPDCGGIRVALCVVEGHVLERLQGCFPSEGCADWRPIHAPAGSLHCSPVGSYRGRWGQGTRTCVYPCMCILTLTLSRSCLHVLACPLLIHDEARLYCWRSMARQPVKECPRMEDGASPLTIVWVQSLPRPALHPYL